MRRRARVTPLFARLVLAMAVMRAVSAASAYAQAPSPRPAVVFFVPRELEPDMRAALREALETQLLSLPVTLVFEVTDDSAGTLEERIDAVKRTASGRATVAVFWLETRSTDHWFLYAVDARVERVVLRPLTAKPESAEATVDTVALIVRATAEALLHGESLDPNEGGTPADGQVEPTKPPPAPRSQPVPSEPATAVLRLAAGYVGTTFARQMPWQSGLVLSADWMFASGAFIGLGYTFFQTAHFDETRANPLGPNVNVKFAVERYPVALRSGLRFAVGDFTFTGELDADLEIRNRHTTLTRGLDAQPGAQRIVYSICPKLEGEYSVTSWLRLFAGFGLDIVLDNFSYKLKTTEMPVNAEPDTLLTPHAVRLTVQAGVGIIR